MLLFFVIWFLLIAIVILILGLIKPAFIGIIFFRKRAPRRLKFLIAVLLFFVVNLFLFNFLTKVQGGEVEEKEDQNEETETKVGAVSGDFIEGDPSIQDGMFIPEYTGTPVEETAETVVGCMDVNALNYNSVATLNDKGLCEYESTKVSGCTDPAATNYNSSATKDDGSCKYDLCDGITCSNHGDCVAGECVCDPGYKGLNCENEDLCYGISCNSNSVCNPNNGDCECVDGYHDNGSGVCIPD